MKSKNFQLNADSGSLKSNQEAYHTMENNTEPDNQLNFKIKKPKDIRKIGQILSVILYIILIILTVGFSNTYLYFTSMNLAILSELIFMAFPFMVLFYAYRKLKLLYYSYFFSAGYFMLTFSIISDVNTERLQQLGYSNIDILIGVIGWALLIVLIYLPWKYKKIE